MSFEEASETLAISKQLSEILERFFYEEMHFEFTDIKPVIKERRKAPRLLNRDGDMLSTAVTVFKRKDEKYYLHGSVSSEAKVGYGTIYYVLTAIELERRGLKLVSDGLLYPAGEKLWSSLERKGLAYYVSNGNSGWYEFVDLSLLDIESLVMGSSTRVSEKKSMETVLDLVSNMKDSTVLALSDKSSETNCDHVEVKTPCDA